ncbi:Glycerol-3-phosphate ABC transporter, permease protein UgpA [Rubellimicrobium mesophilum DSM 19309]|uniref:Glycerol-3-phosphate ABC transporter, permease protein UgpA n=1 Tax=Rubellimicrobium mesophilum DSM 19309 TaxID=442562 RepID=A0A017HR40_9RHOB|nr:sugar ABC transporter permease [Rubellimicrobium mesophilum]EYD76603.1 Glycerol-3-phosphate ABC transporter, permease protein UgpA [Rubellimicrobium mesophilum DSM 19309]
MLRTRRSEILTAFVLLAPFIVIYGLLFVWPTIQMVMLTFTKAPLIGAGDWVGLKNYERLWGDRLFWTATWNTLYFVLLTVIPSTLLGLLIALGVNRLKGWAQSLVLAAFFIPYILPVSVVYRMWGWMLDSEFGILQHPIAAVWGENVPIFRTIPLFIPAVAFITVWWLIGFNILLFIAGLRNISSEIYEAAELDGATRWQTFRRITWPLIWPITVLVATIQLILQLKIFDQIYLFAQGGRVDATLSLVGLIYRSAFQKNQGGYGATVALVLFMLIVVISVLQFQLLRARGQR